MHFLRIMLIYCLLMTCVSGYGAWLMDREQVVMMPNPLQELCIMLASSPGYSAWLSITSPAPRDIDDDRPPEAWPQAWFIAPLSGLAWGIVLSVTAHGVFWLGRGTTRAQHLPA